MELYEAKHKYIWLSQAFNVLGTPWVFGALVNVLAPISAFQISSFHTIHPLFCLLFLS